MIITIHGQAGSGKSSISKLLASRLKYRHYSIGDLRREIAKKHGITLAQLNRLGETEDWTDREPDKLQEELGKNQDDFVIDGRTCFHFIPHSFKVYLHAGLEVRARRVFRDERKAESFRSIKDAEKALVARERSDIHRYKKYYRLDITDMKHYDLVIDTTKLSKKQIVERIMEAIKHKKGKIRK
ncbi:MAG: cytidylate kinase family protein [Candidatus Aenigmarchaeota archaeon]|nr:cytidylate kinase family protein [Candidatus Aenigmarchaeota archaeon]